MATLASSTVPLSVEVIDAWLRLSADRLRERSRELTELDQAIGDGDHGINMDRGFSAVVAMLDQRSAAPEASTDASTQTPDVAATLKQAAQTLIRTVGGASGPLYGTFFLKASATLAQNQDATVADLIAAFDAGVAGIGAIGGAQPGDKTMLDALLPGLAAAREGLEAGAPTDRVMSAAADAAELGAKATVPLVARKGRASYLGERSVGHQDPGATSSAILLRALADSFAS
jgi:dihydroxyacetone kinase-like protein